MATESKAKTREDDIRAKEGSGVARGPVMATDMSKAKVIEDDIIAMKHLDVTSSTRTHNMVVVAQRDRPEREKLAAVEVEAIKAAERKKAAPASHPLSRDSKHCDGQYDYVPGAKYTQWSSTASNFEEAKNKCAAKWPDTPYGTWLHYYGGHAGNFNCAKFITDPNLIPKDQWSKANGASSEVCSNVTPSGDYRREADPRADDIELLLTHPPTASALHPQLLPHPTPTPSTHSQLPSLKLPNSCVKTDMSSRTVSASGR